MTTRGHDDPFAHRASAHRARRRRRFLIAAVSVVVLAALAWVVGFSPVLAVNQVEVEGADPADRARVNTVGEQWTGTPLARVDTDQAAAEVAALRGVAHVRVERAWPNTLRLVVTSREPALAVRTNGKLDLVDHHGVRYRTVTKVPKGVPEVRAEGEAEVSQHAVSAARSMLAALPADQRAKVRDVRVDAAEAVTFRIGSTTVVWGDASDPELKVKVMEILLAKKPKRIDLTAPNDPATTPR